MAQNKKKRHGKRPPPPAGRRTLRLDRTGYIDSLPEELRAALRTRLSQKEQIQLEMHWRRLDTEALRQALHTAMDIIYVVVLRIAHDRLGADRDRLEEVVELIDDYLTDLGNGRIKTEDLVSSLREDGLEIDKLLAGRI